jgi:hypothetical protein
MESSKATNQVLAPLIIGVTGHRDLRNEDRDILSQQVRSLLVELKAKYPFTPLLLLSPLAEGADRLVAQVALEPGIEARLIVPLPMPIRCYEQDFRTPESLAEFSALLQRAERSFEIKLLRGNTEEGLRRPELRDMQYQEAGKFIARQSQILIALWDGTDTNLVGGTAQIVRFQTEGVSSAEDCDLAPHERFPVYHVLTPRLKNPNPPGKPFTLRTIYPDVFEKDEARARKYYAEMFARLDEFNRNVSQADSVLIEGTNTSKSYLFGEAGEKAIPPERTITLQRYAFADALAVDFHQRMIRTQKILHWSVFLSFACFGAYAHLPKLLHAETPGRWPGWLWASIGFFSFGYWIYESARKRRLETNYLDYRAVAEGMRIKLFWELSGVPDRVEAYYLTKQRTELDWICNLLRGWYCLDGEEGGDSPLLPEDPVNPKGVELAVSHWVDDQRKYFKTAAEREHLKSEQLERWVRLSLRSAAIGAVLLAVVMSIGPVNRIVTSNEWLHGSPFIVIELLLAAGALLHHYNERMAYSQHAKQYRRMRVIFDHALELIGNALQSGDYRSAHTCLLNLGKEALTENGDWVLIHRERPLELPHP